MLTPGTQLGSYKILGPLGAATAGGGGLTSLRPALTAIVIRAARLLAVGLCLTIAAPVGAQTWDRLGRDVVPRSETIELQLDPRKPGFSGRVRAELDVPAPVDSFRFHAKDLTIERVTLRGPSGPVVHSLRPGPNGLQTVLARTALKPGAYALEISYSAPFDSQATGIFRVRSGDAWYAYSYLWPAGARRAFPCWDEPAFKIPWKLSLRVPRDMMAVANTPIAGERTDGEWRVVTFAPMSPMPSYMINFGVGMFDTVPIRGMSVPGRVVTVKGAGRLAGEAAALTPLLMAALERYYGRPCPYDKLDLLAVPEFAIGAMENAGAISFLDSWILIDPAEVTPSRRLEAAGIIAHEMAHLWFGDLVTVAWWDDLWLSESFASWMGEKVTSEVLGELFPPSRPMRTARAAFDLDVLSSTRAMRRPVKDRDNLDQLLDVLTYNKGEVLLGMLEHWCGPAEFRRGVGEFLRLHAWGNATGTDLWTTLSLVTGRDVSGPMASFLDQPGVPLVTVEAIKPGRVRLSQRRFQAVSAAASEPALWKIPVTLKYPCEGGTCEQRILLTQASQECSLAAGAAPAWVHPNAGEHGYYRWRVPAATFRALLDLPVGQLDVRERIGLVSNAMSLMNAGLMDGGTFVQLVGHMAKDPDPSVLEAAVEATGRIREAFGSGPAEPLCAAWIRRVFQPALLGIGTERRAAEPELVTELRPRLLALLGRWGNDSLAIAAARRTVADYFADPLRVDAALVPVALAVSAASGDRALFEDYRQRFVQAPTPAERAMFLEALCSFRDASLADRMLDDALAGPLRPQEVARVPRLLARDPSHAPRVREWVLRNHDAYVARIPLVQRMNLPALLGGCDTTHIEEDARFLADPSREFSGVLEEFGRVADACRSCAALRAREQEAALQAFGFAGRPQAWKR